MYNHFRGLVAHKDAERVVLDVGGTGYELTVARDTAGRLPPPGREATVLAHLVVREDELRLYGFLTEDEREMFRTLISLSGIGPAIAMQALSAMPPVEFFRAVQSQDAAAFKRVKGIGEKTAKRIILELKGAKTRLYADGDRAGVEPGASPKGSPEESAAAAPQGDVASDAALALRGLGLTEREAADRVARAWPAQPRWTLEELIRFALRM